MSDNVDDRLLRMVTAFNRHRFLPHTNYRDSACNVSRKNEAVAPSVTNISNGRRQCQIIRPFRMFRFDELLDNDMKAGLGGRVQGRFSVGRAGIVATLNGNQESQNHESDRPHACHSSSSANSTADTADAKLNARRGRRLMLSPFRLERSRTRGSDHVWLGDRSRTRGSGRLDFGVSAGRVWRMWWLERPE